MRPRIMWCLMVMSLAAGAVRAEIYEWRDTEGVKHFTNNMESIPTEHRSDAHVVVEATPAPAGGEAPRANAPRPTPRENSSAAARRKRKASHPGANGN
ncbi:MAG TPA: DUF4124 domain-containing protein [Candidatus Acidoferrales bacterium]|nr:DUF4124 domain-containing protein [Candidatus Acidoferrales bacterium]